MIEYFLSRNDFEYFKICLSKENKSYYDFTKNSTILSILISITSIVLGLFNLINILFIGITILLSFPFVTYVMYSITMYNESLRQESISKNLSDFLLQASIFPKNTDIVRILEYARGQDFGELTNEIRICLSQIKKGYMIKRSLEELIIRNRNNELEKSINIMILAYESGSDLRGIFENLAKDIIKTREVNAEKKSNLALQKYTLLISAAVLIPIIMSWILQITSTLSFTEISNSNSISEETVKIAIQIYIIELAIISSVFASLIENNLRKFIIYFILTITISAIIFVI